MPSEERSKKGTEKGRIYDFQLKMWSKKRERRANPGEKNSKFSKAAGGDGRKAKEKKKEKRWLLGERGLTDACGGKNWEKGAE